MFSDTITITVNAVAIVLNRINQDGYSSEYLKKEATQEYRLKLRNTSFTDKNRGGKKIDRHNVEFVQTVYPVSPATLSTVRKAYAVFENESTDDLVSPAKFTAGMLAFLTEANITKLINFES